MVLQGVRTWNIKLTQAKKPRFLVSKKSRPLRLGVAGFTFVELFLVLLIVGIFIAISLPQLRQHYDDLRFTSFSRELQDFMNYLHQRSIVERKVILFHIDKTAKQYYGEYDGERFKNGDIPDNVSIDFDVQGGDVYFYPNGDIDPVSIKLTGPVDKLIILTSKGVFGGIKIHNLE